MASAQSLRDEILQDWQINRISQLKCRVALALFRAASSEALAPPVSRVVKAVYLLVVNWGFGIELPAGTKVGPRLLLFHGVGLVVHPDSVLGADCVLRHGCTLGWTERPDGTFSAAPVLGDGVVLGASATVIGPVHLGDGAVVGSGSVVIHDVAAGDVVVGNPARVVRSGFRRPERWSAP